MILSHGVLGRTSTPHLKCCRALWAVRRTLLQQRVLWDQEGGGAEVPPAHLRD